MPNSRLTQRRVDALKPCRKTLDVRDAAIRGFGVRILPSGRKTYFLHSQVNGKRIWQSIGDAYAMTLECAREQATSLLAARSRSDEALPDDGQAILFEDVADEVFRRYRRHWKPRTLEVNLGYYRKQILPWFRGRAIGDITRRDVRRWFGSLHATPVAADRSAPVLSVIFRQAEVYGYRPEGSNPCTGIKRYRRRSRERYLNNDEIRRLSHVLDKKVCATASIDRDRASASPDGVSQIGGPRPSVVGLPRGAGSTCATARRARARCGCHRPRVGYSMVCPGRDAGCSRPVVENTACRRTRSIASGSMYAQRQASRMSAFTIFDTAMPRLHWLMARQSSPSGRLLGHNDPATTLKYTHLADASVHEAAEALVPVLGGRAGP